MPALQEARCWRESGCAPASDSEVAIHEAAPRARPAGLAVRGRGLLVIVRSAWPLRRAYGVIERAGLRASVEGGIQGKHEVVAGLQCVRQDGLRGAGLAERCGDDQGPVPARLVPGRDEDRKSTRLNSSHVEISYAVFCLKK